MLKRDTIILFLLLLLAFGLRVWGLADRNVWWDEGVGMWAARLHARDILDWTAHDVHPPLYYLLVRLWWLVVGDGEFVLRFPSVLAGTVGVVLVYGLGRALGGQRAGLLTAFLVTLSRFAVGWSQEIRMYALATTLGTGALWAAVRLWRGGGWRPWFGYVAAVTASLLTIYLAASIPLIANLAFLIAWLKLGRPRHLLFRWVAAQLVAAALCTPWLAYALPRMHAWSTTESFSPLFFVHLYATMLAVGVPLEVEAYTPLTLAVFGVLTAGLASLWWAKRSAHQAAGVTMLLLGLILPALVVYAVSIPSNPFYARPLAPRYLLPLSTCFYTLLGWGLATLSERRRWVAVVGAGLAIAAALSGLAPFYPGRARRDDYVSLAATLRAHRHPADKVILQTDKDWPLFAAQYAGDWQGVPYGAQMDTEGARALLQPLWRQAEGIWLVTTPDAQRADPERVVRNWLEAHAAASTSWRLGENSLSLYARTPERVEALHDLGPDFVPPTGPRMELGVGSTLLGAQVPLPRYLKGDTVHLFLYWSQPPTEEMTVEMAGPTHRQTTILPPTAAQHGPTRQQIDLPLTPDLPVGRYQLLVRIGEEAANVGRLVLVSRNLETTTSPAEITHPLDLRLGESIRLLGYDLAEGAIEPGDTLELALYWQAMDPLEVRYKVFVHLVGQTYNAATDNFLWGQQDNEPVNWQAPTTLWTPGAVVADPYRISVPSNVPPGLYTLEVGMYGLTDGARLPVFGPDDELLGDAVILTQVEVQAP